MSVARIRSAWSHHRGERQTRTLRVPSHESSVKFLKLPVDEYCTSHVGRVGRTQTSLVPGLAQVGQVDCDGCLRSWRCTTVARCLTSVKLAPGCSMRPGRPKREERLTSHAHRNTPPLPSGLMAFHRAWRRRRSGRRVSRKVISSRICRSMPSRPRDQRARGPQPTPSPINQRRELPSKILRLDSAPPHLDPRPALKPNGGGRS